MGKLDYKNYVFCLFILIFSGQLFGQKSTSNTLKPRILISSDIGGTDPDDFQSMIHLLMYADGFNIEGLVSSPFGPGRKADFLKTIALYEKDYNQLKKHGNFPKPDELRQKTKQGALNSAPYKGYAYPTEGSNWIITCAKKKSPAPLWVLVWGGLDDLAQALHDAPEIKKNIRVYWIGGPNKKWSANAYNYVATVHPDVWIIETNAAYRGLFMDVDLPQNIDLKTYYTNYIAGNSALAMDFKNHYGGVIKMGDTPSLAYLMHGNPNNPNGESWGGSFINIYHSPRRIFYKNSTLSDSIPAYGLLEWHFKGPKQNISPDSICFYLEIDRQQWPGYYLGNGDYAVHYASKKPEIGSYRIISQIPELNGKAGKYVSTIPWPGKPHKSDYKLGLNWYSDKPDHALFIADQQGAKTVAKYRNDFFKDWAKRWQWLK